jgi:hypothetical protein
MKHYWVHWLVENYSFEDGEVAYFAEHKDIDFAEYCHSVGTDYKSALADILNNFSVI